MARTERGRQTRQLLVERSALVFERRGFAASSMADLIASSGLTRGAFYFHFESKDAIAVAVTEAQAERWRRLHVEVEQQGGDPLRRLLTLALRAAAAHQTDPVARASGRLIAERGLIRRELPPTAPWWLGIIDGLLAEADDAGQLRDLSFLVRPKDSATPSAVRRLAAQHILSTWSAVSAAASAGGGLPERLYANYAVLLPALCTDPDHCRQLLGLVDEITGRMSD